MMIGVCGRYYLGLSMLILLAARIGSAADVRSPAPQEWDSIVKKAEDEGQVTGIFHLKDKSPSAKPIPTS